MIFLITSPEYLVCDPSKMEFQKGLWFCENVFEAQAVGENAICLGLDFDVNDITHDKAYLEQFPFVLAACANEEKKKALTEELRKRVGIPVLCPKQTQFRGCANLRQLIEYHGRSAVWELILGAEDMPVYGLLELSEIEQPDVSKLPRVLSGVRALDRAIGGFLMGDVSVWTGKRGEGKSTFLSQMLLEAIDRGHNVCAYSGELSAWMFKYWLLLQAAGQEYIREREDKEAGRMVYSVPAAISRQIDAWWDKRFYVYDVGVQSAHDEDSILDIFRYAARVHGCDVFLVDNIMTAKLKTSRFTDFYRAQSNFVGRLVEFAKQFDVHVHLVAHPRKTDSAKGVSDSDDVSGIGDITNRASNVFALKRLNESEAENYGYDCGLQILKNRVYGNKTKIGMCFDPVSKRYFMPSMGNTRRYGWEQVVQTEFAETQERTPFEGGQNGA